jgi:hypothetical protein
MQLNNNNIFDINKLENLENHTKRHQNQSKQCARNAHASKKLVRRVLAKSSQELTALQLARTPEFVRATAESSPASLTWTPQCYLHVVNSSSRVQKCSMD